MIHNLERVFRVLNIQLWAAVLVNCLDTRQIGTLITVSVLLLSMWDVYLIMLGTRRINFRYFDLSRLKVDRIDPRLIRHSLLDCRRLLCAQALRLTRLKWCVISGTRYFLLIWWFFKCVIISIVFLPNQQFFLRLSLFPKVDLPII